ncbi:MAG: ABC transporter substrate-binding protein, partial [Candidatus Izemoplasmatales bacterium]|nr:ABC transporter substrate-binding protein [Candidatus Izemoplasmatales bacterium]
MKKLTMFLVTFVLAIVLFGCNGQTTAAPTTAAPTTAAPTTAAPTTVAPTVAPTTVAPTVAPTTAAPTVAPTTVAPTTVAPTTAAPTTRVEQRVINDTYTLLIQSAVMDGVFNPFFYSSAYDGDVIGMVNVGLMTIDPTGAVVAGDEYPVVAQSYSIFYTDDLDTYAVKQDYEEGDYVVYEIVLKNGPVFSDGQPIDAEDVLFNYYVYLDPAFQGSSTLYTLPILGLGDYRTQVAGYSTWKPLVDQILADDNRADGYEANDEYTEAQFDLYWGFFNVAGAQFAQEIVSYVNSAYAAALYVSNYFATMTADAEGDWVLDGTTYRPYDADNPAHATLDRYVPNVTAADIAASDGLKVAYGMSLWGFGELSLDTLTFEGESGEVYTVADLTAADYWAEILLVYADAEGKVDYAYMIDYEGAGSTNPIAVAETQFISNFADVVYGSVPTIAGLVAGTTTIGGVEHETVKVILTEQNPKAILSLGVTVTPQHYYTAGYTYDSEKIENYGVEFDNPLFMAHLESFNGAPMGAGTYVFVEVADADGTVYFERNERFESMGGDNVYNANIKFVALKIVSSGEYGALEAGDVHYATVSATADVMVDIGESDNLVGILVDNLGYGYICVNPHEFPNLYERIALTTVFNMDLTLEYYPNGLADVIYRSMSQVSWAYPEATLPIYAYDPTLASAISYYQLAGYTWDAVNEEFTDVPEIDFYLPYADPNEHPAGRVFLNAQTLL